MFHFKALRAGLGVLAVGAVLLSSGCGAKPTPSPIHAVNVYLDGIIHSDFRQACSVIVAPRAFPKMASCEAFFVQSSAFFGSTPFKVVAHSEKVWTQTYRGRSVTLATVRFVNPAGTLVLTARLRLTKRGWLLTGVTA